ncbi:MAG TPA: PSD1 and planctomycete cytochrome C domain-containing protein [Gemmataceae bacterium]|nr:PSD1 and planctomycete cytochrome C domain-containing protein [Gemmataceae bacterium]
MLADRPRHYVLVPPPGLRGYGGAVLLLFLLGPAAAGQSQADKETFFETKIRPVLVGQCFKCHGGDKVSGGLRVDSRAALVKGGDRGSAVVPGKADRSILTQALRHDAGSDLKMPPSQKLPAAVVEDFVTWVNAGAVWPAAAGRPDAFVARRHWAFQPVKVVSPPPDPDGGSDNPIDRFVAQRRRAAGLRPVGPADRRALLRRVTFDLIGLPPTPQEMEAFLADDRPDAFARVVERLLASPHYGERWGRYWMDLVRYADTAGDNADYPVPEARLYRDYIIDSFNADKPYDEFVREQLAGDVLAKQGPPARFAERTVATTYLALSRRYLTAPYEQWHLTLEDAIDTTGRAFLGLTLRCARCHDHKFDPVTREDYYALYGIFASTRFPYAGSEEFSSMKRPRESFVPLLPGPEAAAALEARRKRLEELEAIFARAGRDRLPPPPAFRDELQALRRTNLPADLPGAYAVAEGTPTDVPIQLAGDPARAGPVARRGPPRFLAGKAPFIIREGSGRLELARWLTAPENPLFARLMVNRLWQHHFGRGLVATPSNFGLRGDPPTHPELLDWLAAEFVHGGWSVKAMHRLIVHSATYQLASANDAANAARDPANVWYSSFDRRRLDAEAVRDALLAAAGHLDNGRPGDHPFPPITAWGWTQHNPFKDVYPSNHRTVYLMTQRLQRHPFLALFDGPDTNTTTDRRESSTVPLQALFLMNNPFVHEQARGLARRMMAAAPDDGARIAFGYEVAWGRPAAPDEIEAGRHYLRRYQEEMARIGAGDGERQAEAWASLARVLLCANEFIYVD